LKTVALAIPHAAWIPERAQMMRELRSLLGIVEHDDHDHETETCRGVVTFDNGLCGLHRQPEEYREFTDREHWSSWFLKMLRWSVSTGADTFLTLQDDVEVAPSFWPSLSAILEAWPGDVIGLAATHSLGPEVARQGRRSYMTNKVVGWSWAMPMPLVKELLAWCEGGALEAFRKRLPNDGEDTLVGEFLASRNKPVRCPVPTIVDHRLTPSTNEGFDDHTHRRATVTWRAFAAEDMAVPSWWQTAYGMLPADDWRQCWWCSEKPDEMRSSVTGAAICRRCIASLMLVLMGIKIAGNE
jgi:hypothetical protein